MEDKLLYREEVYAIQGALFDVYKTMGNMWGEEVYQQCLEKELALRKIPFEAKCDLVSNHVVFSRFFVWVLLVIYCAFLTTGSLFGVESLARNGV